MWANAQCDGRPAEHRWRPLFNASGLEHYNFLKTDISHGSVVTQLTCGGIANETLVANLLVNLTVKEL